MKLESFESLSTRHIYLLSRLIKFIFIISKISTHNATHNETSDQNRVNQGLLRLISTVEIAGPTDRPPLSRAPRLGPRAFSISVVNSFGGNFVW